MSSELNWTPSVRIRKACWPWQPSRASFSHRLPQGLCCAPPRADSTVIFPDFPQIHTGFIGWGVGFRSGSEVPTLGLEDIAPLIAQLLDLSFSAPDGTSPHNLLEIPD